MNRVSWWVTVTLLVVAIAVIPKFAPESGTDVLVERMGVGERASLTGGEVEVSEITVSSQFVDGDEIHTLNDGYFVEVRAVVRPDKRAEAIRMTIESDGRTYDASDLSAYAGLAEPGFDTPVTVLFEVPRDVIGDGKLQLRYTRHSIVSVSLSNENIKRVKQLSEGEQR